MIKMSQLINMDVYTDKADYIGKVFDVIIDLQKGEAARLTLEPIRAADKDEAKRVFKEKTIMYKNVRAVEKIRASSARVALRMKVLEVLTTTASASVPTRISIGWPPRANTLLPNFL